MATKFFASESVEITVPSQAIPVEYYLRQPQRLVNALVEQKRVEQISREVFRLKMRPLNFMSVKIQPTVDMKVWAQSNGTINLESIACKILGLDYINQRFNLNLKGYLLPIQRSDITYLKGNAGLEVRLELPPPFSFTPQLIMEKTGNGLLKSVLMTIKQRLLNQLLNDYQSWVKSQTQGKRIDSDSTEFSSLKLE
ncbi:DUF1997 domain-containing protein [Mastigocoleus sp. MO_188.B34]|uniref:DUF1997 domain-containing protein n=1 Tax=Mastigocoleus sp. MO_188.B34 TaxID=3036635 RepID=UPI002636167B|nr:DUF1997 domain-containing protein [Mastigocoleus sp. MO_188.B34]MDJ0692780.1 DUF1997 domain-containing protein [Mastigocoleus sp. MO_188.B34]